MVEGWVVPRVDDGEQKNLEPGISVIQHIAK
jgi:hypothetical protein